MSSQKVLRSSITITTPAPSPLEVPHEPARLCKTCREAHYNGLRYLYLLIGHIDDHGQLGNNGTRFQTLPTDKWPNLPRLLDSAQAGCVFCSFLREAILSSRFNDALKHLPQGSITKSNHKRLHFELHYGGKRSIWPQWVGLYSYQVECLIVTVTFEQGPSGHVRFEEEATSEIRDLDNLFKIRPQTISNHEDDEITSFLRGQLKEFPEALETYNNNSYYLPERLIDVDINSLRLVERNNIRTKSGERQQYCALSYCWGPPEDAKSQTKATSKNLQQYVESLDYETLSPVLKDAVKVARSLSIPYLWVDSLCILQDDSSDWQRQCGQMNDIYGNACVTLIAASSRTCNEGFLNPRQHDLRFPCESENLPGITGSFMMYFTHAFSEVESGLSSHLVSDLHNDLKCSQWARRGWTFQEEAMAGARIVFGHFGVYFGWDGEYVSNNGTKLAGLSDLKPVASLKSKDELHQAWENVIRRYTAFTPSSFTKTTDLLPALSGLARLFGDKLQVKYLAGHWVDRLHVALLWVYGSQRALPSLDAIIKRHMERPYLIPTWSFLTRGRIHFNSPNDTYVHQSEITVVDGYISLRGENPYGAIKDACLTIEGFVLDLGSLSWVESQDCLTGSQAFGSLSGVRFAEEDYHPDTPEYVSFTLFDSNQESRKWGGELYDSGPKTYIYGLNLDFQVDLGNQSVLSKVRAPFNHLISRVILLLVSSGQRGEIYKQRYEKHAPEERDGWGLVLVPVGGSLRRSFLRVGTFGPRGLWTQDGLSCLRRLMKREMVRLL